MTTVRPVAIPPPDPTLDVRVGAALTHHLVERPWGQQHVVTAGPADGPPMLLVHGWPQHWFAWRRVIERLAVDVRIIVVDQRGFGWSTTSPRRAQHTTVAEMADDLPAVLDAFDVPQAVLAAHDWGGWIGFRAVERHPERFSAYGAMAIMPPWLSRWSLAMHFRGWCYVYPMSVAGQLVARWGGGVRWMVKRSTTRPVWASEDGAFALESYVARVASGASPAMTHDLYWSWVHRELPAAVAKPRPPRLEVPTTVIVGQHEAISLPCHWWRRTLPGEIDLVTVPEVDHWLAEEAPIAVADVLHGLRFPADAVPVSG